MGVCTGNTQSNVSWSNRQGCFGLISSEMRHECKQRYLNQSVCCDNCRSLLKCFLFQLLTCSWPNIAHGAQHFHEHIFNGLFLTFMRDLVGICCSANATLCKMFLRKIETLENTS